MLGAMWERLQLEHELFKVLRKLTAIFLLIDEHPEMTYRSEDVDCEACGYPYRAHVEHPHAPWLNVLCDGRRVKL
jgi:hypothetical protein